MSCSTAAAPAVGLPGVLLIYVPASHTEHHHQETLGPHTTQTSRHQTTKVRLLQDKSWRVRYAVAQQLPLLSESLGPARTQQELLPSFVALLKDSEAEVRVAAATRVASFCKLIAIDQVPACSCWGSSMDIWGRGGWIDIMAGCALLKDSKAAALMTAASLPSAR